MSTKEVHPIQKKRRRIIDRITFLKSLKWNDFIKQWVADLYDDLEVIDRGESDMVSDLLALCEDNEVMKEAMQDYFYKNLR